MGTVRKFSILVCLLAVAAGLSSLETPSARATPAGINLSWLGTTPTQATTSLLDLPSGTTTPQVDVASSAAGQLGGGLTSDGTYLYYAYMGDIVRSYSDGTSRQTVVANFAGTAIGSFSSLTTESGKLYILGEQSNSGVYSVPVTGGTLTRIDTAPFSPVAILPGASGIGVIGSNLYWTESTGVKTAPKAGGGSETLYKANNTFSNSQTALGLTASGTLLIASATNGQGAGSFYILDTAISGGAWQEVQQAAWFVDSGTTYWSANYPSGILYESGVIYYTGGNGDLFSITTAQSPVQSMIYVDPNATYSGGIALTPPLPAVSKTVTFNANGGTGTMANQSSASAANLSANSFSQTGYTFSGWNTAANGTGNAYANQASFPFTSDATLYAQWTADSSGGGGSSGGDTLPNTGAQVGPTLGISGALLSIGLAITAFAMYRRRKA